MEYFNFLFDGFFWFSVFLFALSYHMFFRASTRFLLEKTGEDVMEPLGARAKEAVELLERLRGGKGGEVALPAHRRWGKKGGVRSDSGRDAGGRFRPRSPFDQA